MHPAGDVVLLQGFSMRTSSLFSLIVVSAVLSSSCVENTSEPNLIPQFEPRALLDAHVLQFSRANRPHGSAHGMVANNTVTDPFEFNGLRRYPAETRVWTTLPAGGDAFYRDVRVALDATLTASGYGDRWRVDIVHPDGMVEQGATITYVASFAGETDCFVSGFSYLCGGDWAWHQRPLRQVGDVFA